MRSIDYLDPRDEFKFLCVDLSIRGVLRISQEIDDFKDVYEGPGRLLLEGSGNDLPILKVTEIGQDLLKLIADYDLEAA